MAKTGMQANVENQDRTLFDLPTYGCLDSLDHSGHIHCIPLVYSTTLVSLVVYSYKISRDRTRLGARALVRISRDRTRLGARALVRISRDRRRLGARGLVASIGVSLELGRNLWGVWG